MRAAHPTPRAATWAFMVLAALLQMACGDGFDPKSLLLSYRVLGIEAEKPGLRFDESTRVRVYDFDPRSVDPGAAADRAAKPLAYTWSICLLPLGSVAEFACADPRLEVPLPGDGPEILLDLGPTGLNLPALVPAMKAAITEATGEPATFTRLTGQIRLNSGSAELGEVETVKNVTIMLPEDPDVDVPNHNPGLRALKVNGNAVCSLAEVDARVDGCVVAWPDEFDTLDLTVELADGSVEDCTQADVDATRCSEDERKESLFLTWYTTAGEMEFGSTNAETLENTITLPDDLLDEHPSGRPVRIFVTVRDGRGGLDVAEGYFVLTPPL